MRRSPLIVVALLTQFALTACDREGIEVSKTIGSDYNRGALTASITEFNASGRSPTAYLAFATKVRALRPGMDELVSEQAERRLLVLALDPVIKNLDVSWSIRAKELATTVWAIGLSPPLTRMSPDGRYDDQAAALAGKPNETAEQYLLRICNDVLAIECKHTVPEFQNAVVGGLAARRFTERARSSIASCLDCNDPAWKGYVRKWEELDRRFTAELREVRRMSDPRRWPTAGRNAKEMPAVITVQATEHGEIDINEVKTADLAGDLRKQVNASGNEQPLKIALHMQPEARIDEVRNMLRKLAEAGYQEVILVSREAEYPYIPRGYTISTSAAIPSSLRAEDTLQTWIGELDR